MTLPVGASHKDVQKDLTENALLIGRVTMQWTTIQAAISHLFRTLSGLGPNRADAVFFAVKSDTSQRDMTLALGRIILENSPDLLKRIIKLFNLIGRLSGERNAVTHAMWAVKMPEGRVTPMPNRGQHRRLKVEDHRSQFDRLIREMSETFRDLVKLETDIRSSLAERSSKGKVASQDRVQARPSVNEKDRSKS